MKLRGSFLFILMVIFTYLGKSYSYDGDLLLKFPTGGYYFYYEKFTFFNWHVGQYAVFQDCFIDLSQAKGIVFCNNTEDPTYKEIRITLDKIDKFNVHCLSNKLTNPLISATLFEEEKLINSGLTKRWDTRKICDKAAKTLGFRKAFNFKFKYEVYCDEFDICECETVHKYSTYVNKSLHYLNYNSIEFIKK